jgi:hypothetical protein
MAGPSYYPRVPSLKNVGGAAARVAAREVAVPVAGVRSRASMAMPPRRIAVLRTRLLPSTKAAVVIHAMEGWTRGQFQIRRR